MAGLLILSRAIHFASCLALLALFTVPLIVGDDGRATRWPRWACLVAAAGSGFLWLWVATAGMNDSGLMESLNPQLFQMVLTQTPPGIVWMFRAGVAVLLAVVLCLPGRRWSAIAGAVVAAIFTGSLAWLGHAGASDDPRRPLMIANDVTHLVAAGIWPAGLLPFALLLRRRMAAGELPAAHAATRRFSAMSLVTVAVLGLSGVINAFFLVGTIHALVSSAYGQTLIVKLALFAGALWLAARNLFVHKPALERDAESQRAIARNVWIELALGTLIVCVVAILGTLPPAAHP